MKHSILLVLVMAVVACGGNDNVAENAVMPDLDVAAETPGDWSTLSDMVGRPPGESGLLQDSAITVDLNALLGRDAEPFKLRFGRGSPLTREAGLLVSVGEDGASYLVLQPGDHAIMAGLKRDGRWLSYVTPGADVPEPPSITSLTRG